MMLPHDDSFLFYCLSQGEHLIYCLLLIGFSFSLGLTVGQLICFSNSAAWLAKRSFKAG